MEAISNMEPAWETVNGRNFALVEYKDNPPRRVATPFCEEHDLVFIYEGNISWWFEKFLLPLHR